MLALRPGCECCDKDLPPSSTEARICSFECTFCAACAAGVLHGICSELRRRTGSAPAPSRGETPAISCGDLEVRADLVVGCDGRHTTVRERAGLATKASGAPIDVLWFRFPRIAGAAAATGGYIAPGGFLVVIVQNRIVVPVLASARASDRLPFVLVSSSASRGCGAFRRGVIGMGVRPEHVATPDSHSGA